MDVDEARRKKQETETEISKIVNRFQHETDMKVDEIDLIDIGTIDDPYRRMARIDAKLDLNI